MVLGLRSKSKKSVSIQVHYIIHVQEIKPWPPSQSLRSAKSVLLQWENGDQNSGSLASSVADGRIEFNESFRLSVFMWRDTSKKGKNRESFQKNFIEFHLYDKTVKSQLLGSATINLADFGVLKEANALSTQLNIKRSFRSSAQPLLNVNIQPLDVECSSSSPNSSLSKELSLYKEESESVSQSNDDELEIASFTDDDDDDIPPPTFQTIRSDSETTEDSFKISIGGIEGSNGEFVCPLESTASSSLGNTEGEASTQFNGIKSPSSSTTLSSVMGHGANGRPSLPNISEESVKVTDASSEIPERIQQSHKKNITEDDMIKVISSASYISSNRQHSFERSSQFHVTSEDSMNQEGSTRDQRHNKYDPENVSSVSSTELLEEKDIIEERRKEQEQFTMRNELVNDISDKDSTRKGKSNGATHLISKKSLENTTNIVVNDNAEDVRTVKFAESKSQTLNQAEEINNLNDVHVGTACHGDINVNGSVLNDKTELKAEVEMLREELREAAALEVSLYSVIAEHGSSSNKVHAPARRLSRFYFHACRVGSPSMKASAAQSAVSGFVLVSKACGNDVPRLTFWFSNLILLRATVTKEFENTCRGDHPCTNSECDGISPPLHEEEKENTEKHSHSWDDPEMFLVALEKVEAWMFSRIVESVWWQTLTPYMQSAATKSSRKNCGKRYGIGNEDQGSFSIDLWKRAFRDACERLCPLRAGGHECGCLPMIARLVMEQLVNRLDVAMFNAILRESAEEMPTDPISDPISDSKVLPIPSGKSGFGAGAQLKNAIGDWSRWLSNLFGIDDSDSHEDNNENEPKFESSFKSFNLLNALSDLMMLPFEMLADGSMRKEVCPRFGVSLIKRVVNNFVPDEFCPGPIPDAVIEALNDEDIQDVKGSITSIPCNADSTLYAPPPASSIVGMLHDVGTQTSLRSGSFALRKLYTSDDELDELDSPLSALGMDDTSLSSKKKFAAVKGDRKVVRYDLLRQVWKSTE